MIRCIKNMNKKKRVLAVALLALFFLTALGMDVSAATTSTKAKKTTWKTYFSYDKKRLINKFTTELIRERLESGDGEWKNIISESSLSSKSISTSKIKNGAVTAEKLNSNGCSNGQILKFNGTKWACAVDSAGGDSIFGASIDSSEITNGTIADADVSSSAAIAYSKLNLGTNISSANITDLAIVNADVNGSAAIAGTKISPDFGNQNVTTTGTVETTGFKLVTTPTAGYVLTANAAGVGTWQVSGAAGTTYTAPLSDNLLKLVGTEFSVKQGAMTDDKFCKFTTLNGLVCNTDTASSGLTGTGTIDRISKFSAAGVIGDSSIGDITGMVKIGGNLASGYNDRLTISSNDTIDATAAVVATNADAILKVTTSGTDKNARVRFNEGGIEKQWDILSNTDTKSLRFNNSMGNAVLSMQQYSATETEPQVVVGSEVRVANPSDIPAQFAVYAASADVLSIFRSRALNSGLSIESGTSAKSMLHFKNDVAGVPTSRWILMNEGNVGNKFVIGRSSSDPAPPITITQAGVVSFATAASVIFPTATVGGVCTTANAIAVNPAGNAGERVLVCNGTNWLAN